MSSNTPNLGMPFVQESQSQKHVTVNESLSELDALVQPAVINQTTTTPPVSPNSGDRYIPAATATGDWLGEEGNIAYYEENAWKFYIPEEGWAVWDKDVGNFYIYDGAAWGIYSGPTVTQVPFLGINDTANTSQRLISSSNEIVHSFDPSGTNSSVVTINRNSNLNTSSLIYSTSSVGDYSISTEVDDLVIRGPGGVGCMAVNASGFVSFPQMPYFCGLAEDNITYGATGIFIPYTFNTITSNNITITASNIYTLQSTGVYEILFDATYDLDDGAPADNEIAQDVLLNGLSAGGSFFVWSKRVDSTPIRLNTVQVIGRGIGPLISGTTLQFGQRLISASTPISPYYVSRTLTIKKIS